MQSCQGVAWWAHRADAYVVRERSSRTCTESKTVIGSKDPHAFENYAPRGGIYTTENVASPFQAEPAHLRRLSPNGLFPIHCLSTKTRALESSSPRTSPHPYTKLPVAQSHAGFNLYLTHLGGSHGP